MDYGTMISRAWVITRQYTWLWILGLLVLGLGSGNVDLSLPSSFDITGMAATDPLLPSAMMGVIILTGLLATVGVALWVVGALARGALISAVDQIEREGGASLVDAWLGGIRCFGRLFLIGLPVAAPALLLTFLTYVAALPGSAGGMVIEGLGSVVTLCLLPLCCLLTAASLALTLIQAFADRAAVIEDLGPGAAWRRGWSVLVEHQDRLPALAVVWALLTVVVRLLVTLPTTGLILPVVFLGVVGAPVGSGPLAVVCLAGFLTVLAMLLYALVSVFTSTLWTLAYRDWTGLPPGKWAADLDAGDEAAPKSSIPVSGVPAVAVPDTDPSETDHGDASGTGAAGDDPAGEMPSEDDPETGDE